MNTLICPVCGEPLINEEKCCKCCSGHSFDIAKEGYVNLIAGSHKPGSATGDSRNMALSRRAFLNKGYYSALRNALCEYIDQTALKGPALDICCGEGYYTGVLKGDGRDVYAFDLSREMVRLAAKRHESFCFVANISSIPIADGSISIGLHLFAPFHNSEFSRVMSSDGILLTAVPGRRHLMGMKEILYEKPYENDECPPAAPSFSIVDTIRVYDTITLECSEDIASMLNMTPYGVRSPKQGKEKLLSMDKLDTEIEFVFYALQKK